MEKIAFVCQRYGKEVNGGSELHCRQVAERLSSCYEVDVYTTCAIDYVTWKNEYPAGESYINGVHVFRYPVKHERQRIRQGLLSRWIQFSPSHSDAAERAWIHAQGPVCDEALDDLWEKQEQYKVIIFMTYLYYLTAIGMPRGFRHAMLIPTLHDEWPAYLKHYDRVFSAAQSIVWNSPEELAFATQRFPGIEKTPSDIVGVGIEIPEKTSLPERITSLKDPYIVYVGRLDVSKGCGELFDFFVRYKETYSDKVKLVLVGKQNMPIPEREDIIPLGFVSDEEKFGVMRNARGLVLCSQFESLSMVVLESMLLGRPVLVNGKSEVLQGHIERSGAGISYVDFDTFCMGIRILAQDDERYRTMSVQGIRYVKENYSWDTIIKKLVLLIEQTDAN